MPENNIIYNESFNVYQPAPTPINMTDIIGAHNAVYMDLIFYSSLVLLVYVIWMNFFYNSKYQRWLESKDIDIHELTILPIIILVITTLAYKGVI